MEKVFQAVQQEFMHLSLVLSRINFEKNSITTDTLMQVNDALTDTYVLLNEGFCERVELCERCVHNRNQLQTLMQMVDQCETNTKVDEETFIALEAFTRAIPLILTKMEIIYLNKEQHANRSKFSS